MNWRERWQKCMELRQKFERLALMRSLFMLTNHGQTEIDYTVDMVKLATEYESIRLWWMRPLSVFWRKS